MTLKRQESKCGSIESTRLSQVGDSALPPLLVVELGQRIGSAVCGGLLAQLGATVVAIEDEGTREKCTFSTQLCAGKLRVRRGQGGADAAVIADIAAKADIVLLSSDIGGTYEAACDTQIVCDVTACGSTGPLAGQPLSDAEIQALTGVLHTTGAPEGAPVLCPVPILEYLAGLNAAAAVIAALGIRRKFGIGQAAEVALYDCGFGAMSSFFARLLGQDGAVDIGRIGNRHGLSSPWNVYRAVDGWIQICTGSDEQWQRLCVVVKREDLATRQRFARSIDRVANNAEVDAIVQNWVGTQTVTDCIAALTVANIAGGAIVPVNEYPSEANLDYRGMIQRTVHGVYVPGSPMRMSRTPGRTLMDVTDADKAALDAAVACARSADPVATPGVLALPLADIRVLEVGHYTTAPGAARMFAALGADVIKIEPPEGEASRAWPPIDRGQSTFYTVTNSGKRGVVLDLGSEEGRSQLRALIAQSDVLIENMKPNALAKRGFGAGQIADINPRMIYCAISGFGAQSQYPGRPAFDTVVQAMSGLMHLVRAADGAPMKTGISIADVMGAAVAVVAVLAALEERHRSGEGQVIDLSMQDIMAWATQVAWNRSDVPQNSHILRTADGDVLVTDTKEPVPAMDIRNLNRMDAVARLRRAGYRAVPAVSPADVLRSEQAVARNLCFNLTDERGAWPTLGVPIRLARTPLRINRPSPALGRDTAEVFGNLSSGAPAAPSSGDATLHVTS